MSVISFELFNILIEEGGIYFILPGKKQAQSGGVSQDDTDNVCQSWN